MRTFLILSPSRCFCFSMPAKFKHWRSLVEALLQTDCQHVANTLTDYLPLPPAPRRCITKTTRSRKYLVKATEETIRTTLCLLGKLSVWIDCVFAHTRSFDFSSQLALVRGKHEYFHYSPKKVVLIAFTSTKKNDDVGASARIYVADFSLCNIMKRMLSNTHNWWTHKNISWIDDAIVSHVRQSETYFTKQPQSKRICNSSYWIPPSSFTVAQIVKAKRAYTICTHTLSGGCSMSCCLQEIKCLTLSPRSET